MTIPVYLIAAILIAIYTFTVWYKGKKSHDETHPLPTVLTATVLGSIYLFVATIHFIIYLITTL